MKLKSVLTFLFAWLYLAPPSNAHSPTWTKDIACIIYSHCSNCHNPGGVAPFSLITYNDVFQNRFSIAASVQARSMPPFPANQDKRLLAHANTLSEHEIDDIVDWVNNFAPLGDANNIPTPPTFSSGSNLPNPDFIAQIPTYTVGSNTDVYRMFVVPVQNASQHTIQSIEVLPGNREIVHHALVFQDTSSLPLQLDQNDPLPGYTAFGGSGSPTSKLLTVFTPGQGVFNFAPGFGAILPAKSYILIQMHYPGGVQGQKDSTQVRIKYSANPLKNVTTIDALNHGSTLTNGPLFIPANTVKTFYNQVSTSVNRTLTGIMPHMHLLGKSIKAYGITPSKDTIHLIDIPEWDFHWQYFYQFQKPILLPAGSTVYGEATYDNTANNPNNPNDPPKDVGLGEGTEDEMFLIYMNLSSFQASDTSIVIDTASHFQHLGSCSQTTGLIQAQKNSVQIFPNPVKNTLQIEGIVGNYSFQIFNQEAKLCLSGEGKANQTINLEQLPNGLYFLQIIGPDNLALKKKICIEH